jgi:hypothetical protein
VALHEHHADFVYSDDGRFALQRSRSAAAMRFPQEGQLFRVDDWEALGPRLAHDVDTGFEWLFAPDGSALLGSGDFVQLTLFEPATLAPRWTLQVPDRAPVRAWRFSHDGRWLALGTTSGRVWLVDVVTGHVEGLPSTPTATVRWLEFDATGNTLAARAEDGSLAAWDVATRRPRMGVLRDPRLADVHRLRLVGDTIIAAGDNGLHMMELAPASPFNREAVPASASLRQRRNIMGSAFDVHAGRRLLVIGGTDGLIGIWRLPRPALLPTRAAPLPALRLDFDGRHVVAVDGRRVQLIDVDSGDPRSPAFLHPQPVRFAERSADGAHLATVAGRTLRVFDTSNGALRGPPLLLPQAPLRAALSSDGSRLLLTTIEYVDDAVHERLHLIDLHDARPAAAEPVLPGLIAGLALDERFSLLLRHRHVEAPGASQLAVLDLDGRTRHCDALELESGEMPGHSVVVAGSAWTYVSTRERRGQLLRWDTGSCRVLQRLALQQGAGSNFMLAHGDGVAFNQLVADSLSLFGHDGRRRDVPGMAGRRTMKEFALSRDGRRAAVAGRNAVQVFDVERGERLSAPLLVPIAGNDAIAKLAFSPDAGRLLARTLGGRWLAWDLPATADAPHELAAMASVLDPSGADAELSAEEFRAVRELLRRRAARPAAAPASRLAAVEFAPAAGEQVDPRFVPLDLRSVINVSLTEGWPPSAETPGDAMTLPMGPHRLNDVDWRIEGGVQLNGGGPATHFGPPLPLSAEVPLPDLPLRHVHVLLRVPVPISPRAPPKIAARVLLVGEDGRQHALDVLTRRHLVPSGWNMESILDPGARIAWAGIGGSAVRGGHASSSDVEEALFAVAFEVPGDTGRLRGLRLAVGDGPIEAPLVYAVTLERATDAAQTSASIAQ